MTVFVAASEPPQSEPPGGPTDHTPRPHLVLEIVADHAAHHDLHALRDVLGELAVGLLALAAAFGRAGRGPDQPVGAKPGMCPELIAPRSLRFLATPRVQDELAVG
jgi:hypothetical protein